MHRTIKRTEAWGAAAILFWLLVGTPPAVAQESFLETLLDKSLENFGRKLVTSTQPVPADDTAAGPSSPDAADDSGTPAGPSIVNLALSVNQSKTVPIPDLIKRVKIDNPAVVEAMLNKKNLAELIVTGKGAGMAEILVTDRSGAEHRIDVRITQKATPLQFALSQAFPHVNIQVIEAGDGTAVLSGQLENPQAVDEIIELAKSYYPARVINGLQVVGSQQVQLRVMIAEVSRTKLRALGFNFLRSDSDSYFTSSVGNLITVTSVNPLPPTATFSTENNFTFGKIDNARIFRGFLRALKQEGLAKIHTDTALIAYSGRAASLNDGGEFPIPVPDTQGKVTFEFKDYGNKLDFVPIVLGGGRIRLEVRPELSELDRANGVNVAGFFIPAIKKRVADTSVELNSGESFVIGGLLRTAVSCTTNKVPYLGDVAIIGSAFRTVSYQQEEKELIIMLTPELVEPLKPAQKPCAYPGSESTHPADHELSFLGRVESPACNACEINRRSELMLKDGYPLATRPCVDKPAARGSEGQADAVSKSAGAGAGSAPERTTPSETERPGNLPGLLGPLGYDAGR